MEDDDWWQTGPPEMYELPSPPSPPEIEEVVLGDPKTEKPTTYPPTRIQVERHYNLKTGCRFRSYTVTDQPNVHTVCRDGVVSVGHDPWTDHQAARAAGVEVVKYWLNSNFWEWRWRRIGKRVPDDKNPDKKIITAIANQHSHYLYQLVTGCQEFGSLDSDEQQHRSPTPEGRLDEPCSRCPYAFQDPYSWVPVQS